MQADLSVMGVRVGVFFGSIDRYRRDKYISVKILIKFSVFLDQSIGIDENKEWAWQTFLGQSIGIDENNFFLDQSIGIDETNYFSLF